MGKYSIEKIVFQLSILCACWLSKDSVSSNVNGSLIYFDVLVEMMHNLLMNCVTESVQFIILTWWKGPSLFADQSGSPVYWGDNYHEALQMVNFFVKCIQKAGKYYLRTDVNL